MVAVVFTGHSAATALPGKVTLISPSGQIGATTPTYSWNADPSAIWYYLWVNDSTGNRITQWYTAAQGSLSRRRGFARNARHCSFTGFGRMVDPNVEPERLRAMERQYAIYSPHPGPARQSFPDRHR